MTLAHSACDPAGGAFRLTLITDDPSLALRADAAGVQSVGVDLERLGKAERQNAHAGTRLSRHDLEGLVRVGAVLRRASLFVRLNPVHADSPREVEAVLARGATELMLPFFRTAAEVETFVRLVDRRARVVLLLETAPAAVRIRDILSVGGFDAVMFGLNDLRLQFGLDNHFEMLASPLMDGLAAEVSRGGLPLSLGGLARHDDGSLPVPSDLVYAQYPRLGASGAWLARSFLRGVQPGDDLGVLVGGLRARMDHWAGAGTARLEQARLALASRASNVGRFD